MRAETAEFLSHLSPGDEMVRAALKARLATEDSPAVAADILMALATLHDGDLVALTEPWVTDGDRFRRIVGFSARALHLPADEEAIHQLVRVLPHGVPTRGTFWGVGSPATTVEVLTADPGWVHHAAVSSAVTGTVLHLRGWELQTALDGILTALFPAGAQVPDAATELPHALRELLNGLRRHPDLSRSRLTPMQPVVTVLTHWRLPSDPPSLRRWLRGAPRTDCLSRLSRAPLHWPHLRPWHALRPSARHAPPTSS